MIEAVAGRGGMGLVYRARQRGPDRVVAIKVVAPQFAVDPDFRARFEQESTIAAQIEHANVISVYAVGEQDGLLFIAMRYVEGVDLRELLKQTGRLEPRRAAQLIAQSANALDAAHARGLVHRDVKPANILVAAGDHVYLTDFGLTKRTDQTQKMTATGMFAGSGRSVATGQAALLGSEIAGRSDAWRCTFGNVILDPCFTTDAGHVLCPTAGPFGTKADLLKLSGGLPSGLGNKDEGTNAQPWAIELADGSHCLLHGGATTVVAGQRLNYECDNGVELYGDVKRSGRVDDLRRQAAEQRAQPAPGR